MKKPLWVGFGILVIIAALSIVNWDFSIAIKLSGYVGLIALILAALFSGAFIDPDSRRVDMATEGRESMNRRFKLSTFFLLVGLPNLLVCIILYFGSKWF
ncbi:hypothetical protein ABD76_01670 [Paenibacillus dendritiformis]|uniref:DUF5316 domain-containing protein n=1 Tax=Paenibacillus dendritiformis TaxID=130049 RepID=UPI0018CFCD17|nr:DUF5316 domain-containing protein [Paenibacillus dendritiformis]MBG9791314.1 hypothetical protein [Paenibacillus dendritiformis]